MEHLELLAAVVVALAAAAGTGHLLALAGFPIPDAGKRIGCIDGLRGYLALMVLMHHFDLWIAFTRIAPVWGNSSSQLFENFGPGGVALFFMTTGLVFYPRIERGFRQIDWRATYFSRIFRILPLQAVMVGVAGAISLGLTIDPRFGGVFANLRAFAMWLTSYAEPPLFGYGDAHYINAGVLWSLWYEWVFYLVTLPLMALVRDLTRDRLPAYAIPLALLACGLIFGPAMGRRSSIFYLPLFASGMIAWELRRRPAVQRVLAAPVMTVLVGGLFAAAMVWAPGPFLLPQILVWGLFFCCVASGNAFGILGWRASVVLGEISFGIYLIHGTVLFTLFTFVLPHDLPLRWLILVLPFATIAAVLLSAAAHMLVERPGIAIGKRLSGRPRERLSPRVERATLDVAP